MVFFLEMRKLLAVMLIALFAYDVAVDTFDPDCAGGSVAASCHACLCQNHMTAPFSVMSGPAPRSPERTLMAAFLPDDTTFDKSLFHPPKALA